MHSSRPPPPRTKEEEVVSSAKRHWRAGYFLVRQRLEKQRQACIRWKRVLDKLQERAKELVKKSFVLPPQYEKHEEKQHAAEGPKAPLRLGSKLLWSSGIRREGLHTLSR